MAAPSAADIGVAAVPTAHQIYVDRLRAFLGDTAALNVLEGTEENTDLYLYQALQDAIWEINEDFEPETTWSITTIPSWTALKLGAALQVLTGKGILSARNTLTYNDAGGVTVSNYDKYGRYVNYYNILVNKYMRSVTSTKRRYNIDQCYGGVESEYSWETAGAGTTRAE